MTLTQLEYVLAVNKYRHFGKAAASCFVTQPTLSMQIQKLEDELDIIIFDRSKSPILPTPEGEALIEQARVVIRENERIIEVIKEQKNKLEGDLRLAVIPTLAPYLIPLFANDFCKKYPQIRLVIEEYKTEDIITLLEEDSIDAGLLVTPLHKESINERILYYEPFYLFVDPEHPLGKKELIEQQDLDLQDIWLLNKGNCFRDQVLNICAEKRSTEGENLRFEGGNFETLKNMVLTCSGYTILPHIAVTQLPEEYRKLVRRFDLPVPTREISLVHGRNFVKKAILDILEKEIKAVVPDELKKLSNNEIEVVEIY